MGKKLSEMTLEELWELFPIILVEHNDAWKEWYASEAVCVSEALSRFNVTAINHIGSTAIDTIWAKPIIDILVEVAPECEIDEIRKALVGAGYICMNRSDNRMSFNKGYTENGFAERVFHLHLRYTGDNDEIYFRDYLNAHAQTAKEYEKLKFALWKKFEHDRDGYTEAKSDFVKKTTSEAKRTRGK